MWWLWVMARKTVQIALERIGAVAPGALPGPVEVTTPPPPATVEGPPAPVAVDDPLAPVAMESMSDAGEEPDLAPTSTIVPLVVPREVPTSGCSDE